MDKCVCFSCDRILEEEPCSEPLTLHPIYDGLIFRSNGNYGSTIFDPMPIGIEEMLQIIICDDCIKRKGKRVTRIHNIKRKVTADAEPFVLGRDTRGKI